MSAVTDERGAPALVTTPLDPCPFDGATAYGVVELDDDPCEPAYAVLCSRCEATGPERQTAEEAAGAWNGRQR